MNKSILVTGSKGFIGTNFIKGLPNKNEIKIFKFNKQTSMEELEQFIKKVNFIYHFAGEVKPTSSKKDFLENNTNLTAKIIYLLEKHNKRTPILMTSSIHAIHPNNDYGISKQKAEKLLIDYSIKNNTKIFIFRLPHIFGEGCKPNYNSVITTWIYNTINNLSINIYDRNTVMTYIYIQDLINNFLNISDDTDINNIFYEVTPIYKTTLGKVYDMIQYFRKNGKIKNIQDEFEIKLFKVFLYYKDVLNA